MRRNLAAVRLGIQSQLEYRINFAIDAVIQPFLTGAVEVVVWSAIVTGMAAGQLGGYGPEYYIAYALWANFVGRVTTNWMYEYNMLNDIERGSINSILVRPTSFYEFYLCQFMGYKGLVLAVSFVFPLVGSWLLGAPLYLERLPGMILLILYYLVLVHTLSFSVSCIAFFLNRAHAFTNIKNLVLWVLAGELIPLDLYPEPLRTWMLHSPFAAGVYIPVGYISGRIGHELFLKSFMSITIGLVFAGLLAAFLWRRGVRSYTGTGA